MPIIVFTIDMKVTLQHQLQYCPLQDGTINTNGINLGSLLGTPKLSMYKGTPDTSGLVGYIEVSNMK